MRRRRATILLALVSALGTVLLVDVTFLVLRGPVRTLENFYEPAAGFGYRMRPNAEFVFASPYHGYSATVRTNARGLRDDEIHVPKPPGTFRVLLLGDSMTAGLEVSKDETFEAVCEERLRTFGEVEVVNAGVRGYNLDNILRFFESEGASYAPDLVAYLFVENDLKSASKPEPNMLDHSRGFTLRGAWGWLASYSHITFRLAYLRQMLQLRRERDRDEEDVRQVNVPHGIYELLRNPRFDSGPAYLNTAERIATLASLCHQAGADFLLAGAPHRLEIDPGTQAWWNRYLAGDRELDFDAVRAYLDWVAARHGLERFDPVPAYRRGWRDGQPYWFHNRLLGQQLGERIQAMPRFQAWRRARARPSDPPES
jgi:lysophospholipase L1-like esterase